MDKAQDLSSFSMMDLFRVEIETQALILNNGLLALEGESGSPEKIEPMMRAAHSIKGAARIVGLDPAVNVAHALEDCLVAARDGKIVLPPEAIDELLRTVDLIGRIAHISDADMNGWLEANSARIQGQTGVVRAILQAGAEARRETQAGSSAPAAVPAAEVLSAEPDRTPPPPLQDAVGSRDRVVRVTAENLDRLMGLAGESLVEARWLEPFSSSLMLLKRDQAQLSTLLSRICEASDAAGANRPDDAIAEAYKKANQCRQSISERIQDIEVFARRSANLSNRLYREVIASRMRPFADGVEGFPRMVRDLSRKLGKRVALEISGKSTGVDRDILEKLESTLSHLIRNAIDHGIETPEERVAAGKPPEGKVRLEAKHRAGMLLITLSDDGRGVDLDAVRRKVAERKMASPEMLRDMIQSDVMDFLFLPGFSTAPQITEISGRGVGLDVVHTMVHEVGGTVRASTETGKGVTFHLQLPLTLSVIRTLLVEVSGEPYAFPLARIDRSIKLPADKLKVMEDRPFFCLEGENVGLVAAHQVLELQDPRLTPGELSVVVVSDRLNRYGLVVDRFLGERELVVRPLDARLGKVTDISAAGVMGDGSPVLILDVEDLVRSIDGLLSGGRLKRLAESSPRDSGSGRKRILVVDDSITVREVERKLLQAAGYDVDVAVNGIDGWNQVRVSRFDLVITDIDMPRMNGFELVRLIKADASLKRLPVMIVSYKEREDDRRKGLDAGANFYLTKSSFHDETLIHAVNDLIGEGKV
jgi:two-component system sensor histidine kinase and response regulator WspE